LMSRSTSRMAGVGIGGEFLHTMDKPEPAFRCGASRFSSHVRVHGLPAVGRPRQDADDAACQTPRVAATSEAAGVGREGDLESGDAVDEQPIPQPVNRRQDTASQRRGARPGPVAIDAGRRAARVSKKSAIGGAGMRRRRGNRPVGEETEQRRQALRQGWAAIIRTGGWRRWPGPVGRKERDEGARETMRKSKLWVEICFY
jgi:hypothetical protein